MKNIYSRHLPHIQPPGGIIFITFRLANSLPSKVIEQLKFDYLIILKLSVKNKKQNLIRETKIKKVIDLYDQHLHKTKTGPFYLRKKEIAKLVSDSIRFNDGKQYDLLSFCVMPNHVHMLFQPLKISLEEYVPISKITHSLKSYTSNCANKILNRSGQFWDHESFDRYSRSNEDTLRIIKYILDNPVDAGLVSKREEWKWSYVKSEYEKYL